MNLVVLGCGRSGTSLVAGLFERAGFHVGSKVHPTRDSNPTGFFESGEINQINNRILEARASRNGLTGWVGVYDDVVDRLPEDVRPRIEREVSVTPFCFKDPRFSYTLPAWEGYLGAFTVVCVFRDPVAVVTSLLKECDSYYPHYRMTPEKAEAVWRANYLSVFEHLEPRYRVLYLRYEDVLAGHGLDALGARLGLDLDRSLVRADLNRSRYATRPLDRSTLEVSFRLLEQRI